MVTATKLKLNRHYHIRNGVYISRKKFLCCMCGEMCKPYDFQPMKGNTLFKIAREYHCGGCRSRYCFSSLIDVSEDTE